MIYCVWYPSGGFGHFINAVLTLHGHGFARPLVNNLTFSKTGDSHQLPLVAPKYYKDPETYRFIFNPDLHYSVLIDNGINNEGKKFVTFFPNSTIIKICYSNVSWPIVARTMIDKALKSTINHELSTVEWGHNEDWAVREKYFLFLKDHNLQYAWKSESITNNLLIEDLLDYQQLDCWLKAIGIDCQKFNELWDHWYENNKHYFLPVLTCQNIINNIKNNTNQDLSEITDVWTQAVLYYFLWIEFGQEVPHNDYANFFKDTSEIKQCLNL